MDPRKQNILDILYRLESQSPWTSDLKKKKAERHRQSYWFKLVYMETQYYIPFTV